MVVSFKVSRTGKRYRHIPPSTSSFPSNDEDESQDEALIEASENKKKKKSDANSASAVKLSGDSKEQKSTDEISDDDISFTLNLFPDGYSIGKPVENESGSRSSVSIPKLLHPYDRASEPLFSAIECGRFPGDFLDDIPCKFIDGTAFCEVRDYRKCTPGGEFHVVPGDVSATITKVRLRISLENIVKDIPTIADDGWTYGDMMEVESRILKALEPQLCLDPTPKLDRLSGSQEPAKLDLGLRSMRLTRMKQIAEVPMPSDNKIQGKRSDRVLESSRMGDSGFLVQQSTHENLNMQNNVPSAMLPLRNNSFGSDGSLLASALVSQQAKYNIGVGSPRMVKDQWSGALLNSSVASPVAQDMMNPFNDNNTAHIHGKRDDHDAQSSPITNKKARLMHTGSADGNLPQGQQTDSLHGSDLHWKNTLMQQQQPQQPIARGIQYSNNGMQRFSQQVLEGGLNQEGGSMPFTIGQGIRYNLKEEPVEMERLDKSDTRHAGESELTNIDTQQSRLKPRMPQQFMRSGFPQTPWNNHGQPLDNNFRKEDAFLKRKLVQSPRVSAGGLPQSPLSSKSGEFSSGSIGPQFGAAVSSGQVASQKDKTVTSVPYAGGNQSMTSSGNDSMQRHQAQADAKRRSNSLPKTQISGVGSPASVGNISIPINASSPPVGPQSLADQIMLERFKKIEMVTMRCQLNRKNNKIEEYSRKPFTFSPQLLAGQLSSDLNHETLNDEPCKMPLSKYLVGGNMNVCKTRIMNFFQTERILQGAGFQLVPRGRTRLIMSEKPNDGSVAIHIGEIDNDEYLAAEDFLPTLPNTHIADLLAAQFSSLMEREGYHVESHVQPNPVRMNNHGAIGQLNGGIPPAEMQQFSEGQSNDIAKPSTSGSNGLPIHSSSQILQGPRMLPPGSAQAIQASQGLLPGVSIHSRPPQQPEQPPQQNSLMQQQQQPQFQRSPMMLPTNSMQHLNNIAQNANIHLGAHMANKPSSLQLQLLQQQHQQPQQLQQQQQRKMMGSLGTVGMGSIGNNMVGLGNFGNVMGIGGIRGMTGTGISASIGSISNMNQSPMNLGSALRTGTFTPAQAAYMKMKMVQSRSNMLGNPQSSIGGMPGPRPMTPGSPGLSMLSSALNRGNINPMQQRTATGTMGPPKLMPGMNVYMNPQQQQQQQLQLQQQLQQQQQMQMQQQLQQQQMQQETPPLQTVLSPPQMGSPSSMGIPHQINQPQQQQQPQQLQQQQASPQQMSQRTPMSPQLSSGAIHSMNGGNQEACPPSPQLSSQTMGSVGSINNSPMELQGVNKSNSVNNAQ